MTTQTPVPVLSLSAELARPDDDARRRSAQRWQTALHRLCLLRATNHGTTYEAEWTRIFEPRSLTNDLQQPSKLLAFAALDVMEVQHEIVCDMEGIPYDADAVEELPELLAAMRVNLANDLR